MPKYLNCIKHSLPVIKAAGSMKTLQLISQLSNSMKFRKELKKPLNRKIRIRFTHCKKYSIQMHQSWRIKCSCFKSTLSTIGKVITILAVTQKIMKEIAQIKLNTSKRDFYMSRSKGKGKHDKNHKGATKSYKSLTYQAKYCSML